MASGRKRMGARSGGRDEWGTGNRVCKTRKVSKTEKQLVLVGLTTLQAFF